MMNENHEKDGTFTSTYQPEYAEQARKLCERFGATDSDLADFFSVSVRTIRRWSVNYEAFGDARKAGKDAADLRVERSLYERAVGGMVPAVKWFSYEGVSWKEEFEEYAPPDVRACIFWLCNRQRDRWNNSHMKGVGWMDDDATPQSVTVNIVDGRAEPDPSAG